MFFPYDSANIRYSGRFSLYDGAMTATAAGISGSVWTVV